MLQALQHEPGTSITSEGALATLSGMHGSLTYHIVYIAQCLWQASHRYTIVCLMLKATQASAATLRTAKINTTTNLHGLTYCTGRTGAKTGRSPRDKRVVKEDESVNDIWWNQDKNGSPNFEMDERSVSSMVSAAT